MQGLDTVESLSVEVKGSKVSNFTVLVALNFVVNFVINTFWGESG